MSARTWTLAFSAAFGLIAWCGFRWAPRAWPLWAVFATFTVTGVVQGLFAT